MNFTDYLARVAGRPANANMAAVEAGMVHGRVAAGLTTCQRVAQFVAQLAHESGRFRYDEEVWGPTAAQKRYEGRKDLGNTELGDGHRFRGRSAIQLTGRANYAEFTTWVAEHVDPDAPDFTDHPDLVRASPWEGLAPLWYWSTRGLNRFADAGNIEMVTRRINGGLNGYADRLKLYDRAALVMLGYEPGAVSEFQEASGIKIDGLSGPQTRAALHDELGARDLPFFRGGAAVAPDPGAGAKAAPADPSSVGAPANTQQVYQQLLLAESHIEQAARVIGALKQGVRR